MLWQFNCRVVHYFYEYFTFGESDWSKRGKHLEKESRVILAIELATAGTKPEDL